MFQAISIIVFVTAVLGCVLATKAIFPWYEIGIVIFCVSPPVLIVLMDVYSCIKYFIFGLRRSKLQTFLITLRLICAAGVLLLGVIGLIALLLELPWIEIPFAFGAAAILLGLSKLIYSVWEIARYKRNVIERKVIKNLLLAGKLIFSLLVIYMGWLGMFIGSIIATPR